MKGMKWILLAVVSALLVACASPPKLSRQEQLDMRTQDYPQYEPDAVIEAATKVLEYADGEDTTFAHRESGFLAERDWSMFILIAASSGTWYWDFDTQTREDGGTVATLGLSSQSSSVTAGPTGGDGVQTTSTTSHGKEVMSPAVYELFWARVDYFLELRDQWPVCEDWEKRQLRGEIEGTLRPLCYLATNRNPEDAGES